MPPAVDSFHSWRKGRAIAIHSPFKRKIATTINQSNTALHTTNNPFNTNVRMHSWCVSDCYASLCAIKKRLSHSAATASQSKTGSCQRLYSSAAAPAAPDRTPPHPQDPPTPPAPAAPAGPPHTRSTPAAPAAPAAPAGNHQERSRHHRNILRYNRPVCRTNFIFVENLKGSNLRGGEVCVEGGSQIYLMIEKRRCFILWVLLSFPGTKKVSFIYG